MHSLCSHAFALPPFRALARCFFWPLFFMPFLTGCPSVSELEAQYAPTNDSNLREANARMMKAFRLEPTTAKFVGRVSESRNYSTKVDKVDEAPKKEPLAQAGIAGGLLTQAAPGAPIQFTGSGCMAGGSSCGCGREMAYSFATAKDGTIWVLVPKAQDEVHTVFRIGTCSYGCGVPTEPTPGFVYELSTTDIHKVRGIEVPFEYHVARESCTSSMPAP